MAMPVSYHCAAATDVPPETLYRMLWLRLRVFVVEQRAAYPELDGRDIEPGAELMWASDGDEVLSTLRILADPTEMRIGRVATDAAARGRGIAAELHAALERDDLGVFLGDRGDFLRLELREIGSHRGDARVGGVGRLVSVSRARSGGFSVGSGCEGLDLGQLLCGALGHALKVEASGDLVRVLGDEHADFFRADQ